MRRSHDDATLAGSLRPRGPIWFAVTTRSEPDATVAVVSGEIDVLTAPRLTTRLDDIVRRGEGDLVVDLTEAEFIDSLGLHALLNLQRRLRHRGRWLAVICADGPVRRAIELARLNDALGLASSLEEYRLRRAARSQ